MGYFKFRWEPWCKYVVDANNGQIPLVCKISEDLPNDPSHLTAKRYDSKVTLEFNLIFVVNVDEYMLFEYII